MAGKHSSSEVAVFLVDGYDVLSSKLQSLTCGFKVGTEPVHGLGDTWVKNSPTGLCTATLVQAGAFFDDTLNSIHDAFKTMGATVRIAVWALTGNTIGKIGYGLQGAYNASYDAAPKVGGLTKADVTYTLDGQIDAGVIVQDSVAKTVDWNTKTDGASIDYTLDTTQRNIPITSNTQASPTVITTPVPHGLTTGQVILIAGNTGSNATLNGERTVTVVSTTTFSVPVNCGVAGGTGGSFVLSSTVNGGAGYQAVSALSGFTGFVGVIKHSADDTTYATLATFANVTAAPAAERVVVAAGTTVNRYLCFVGDVTGSGSITPFSVFRRA